jgi:uncharacterized OB-fold protein
MLSQERALPAPLVSPETVAFWEGARQGKLLIKHCDECGENHFYPRSLCPHCFSDRTGWLEASGLGTVYSCSVLRRTQVPYCIACVTLDEGPTMLSNIVDCELDAVHIGQRVKLTFKPAEDGQNLPMFTPI